MMRREEVFSFLDELQENNSKEWMDANRKWYTDVKQLLCDIYGPILEELRSFDPRIVTPNARRGLNRINNNLMFHPERPTYKDHFGFGIGFGKGLADFYIQLGAYECFVAGGIWHPPVSELKKIRSEIDYEGDKLLRIIEGPEFKSSFELFQEDRLRNAPKGYAKDHQYIELLKMKSYAAWRGFDRSMFINGSFKELILESYKILIPLLDFINVAISDE
jgi:uncharacterized protein (TIGR02453 family)